MSPTDCQAFHRWDWKNGCPCQSADDRFTETRSAHNHQRSAAQLCYAGTGFEGWTALTLFAFISRQSALFGAP